MFQSIGVAEEQVYGDLYLSWLRDTHEQSSPETKQLFRDVVEAGFGDRQIVLRRQRLGVNVITSLATLLHRAPLTRLDLHGNALRDVGCDVLSHVMRDMPHLTYLDLGANDIQGSAAESLSAVVAQHPKLSTLILGGSRGDPYANRMTPASTALLLEGCLRSRTLRVLDLSGSQFGGSARSQAGGAGNGEIDADETTELTNAEGTSSWQRRAPSAGGASRGDKDTSSPTMDGHGDSLLAHGGGGRGQARRPIQLLEQLLRTSTTLSTLRIKDVGLTNGGACALIAALHNNTVLAELDMSYNQLSTNVSHALGYLLQERTAMRSHTALSALHMSGNDLFGNRARCQQNDFGVSRKLAAVRGRDAITTSATSTTRAAPPPATQAASASASAAPRQSLQSGSTRGADGLESGESGHSFGHYPQSWGQPGASATNADANFAASASGMAAAISADGSPYLLLAALGNDRALKTLTMDECGVDDAALSILCRALFTNGGLEVLSLRDNDIGSDGAVLLGRALCHHTALQKLYLSGNVLEDEGVCAVATMLETDETLRVLDLQRTWLADRGLIALGVALQTNHSLRVLLLSDNHFTHDGGEAFAAFLEKNEEVVSCQLGATSIPHHTQLRIERATARNTKRADNAESDALTREVVRLHYQHYKLDESRLELDALRDKNAELKRSTENFELQFKQDQSDYLKRKRELEEQMENYTNQEQRYGEQGEKLLSDLQKARAQHEEDMDVTSQRLQHETQLRETVEATFNEVEAELNDWKHNRPAREAALETELTAIKADMRQWATQRKEYKEQIDCLQAAVAALEKQGSASLSGAAAAVAGGGSSGKKRASSVKKKKKSTTA